MHFNEREILQVTGGTKQFMAKFYELGCKLSTNYLLIVYQTMNLEP